MENTICSFNIVCVSKGQFHHLRETGEAVVFSRTIKCDPKLSSHPLAETGHTIVKFNYQEYWLMGICTGLDGTAVCLQVIPVETSTYSRILLYTNTPTEGHTQAEVKRQAEKAIEAELFGIKW